MTIKLTSTGIQMPDSVVQTTKFDASLDKGKLLSVNTYTSSGTWNKPAGCTKIMVVCVGGGGGGCGHTESGGAGGYCERMLDVTGISSVSVTVGGGGDGRTYYQGCGDGAQTSFGSYLYATGGRGANNDWGHTGGRGGHGHGGGQGQGYGVWGGGGRSHGDQGQDNGGGSFFGGAQLGGHHGGHYYRHWSEGINHNPPGTGGGGEWHGHSRGGYGTQGICIVYNYA